MDELSKTIVAKLGCNCLMNLSWFAYNHKFVVIVTGTFWTTDGFKSFTAQRRTTQNCSLSDAEVNDYVESLAADVVAQFQKATAPGHSALAELLISSANKIAGTMGDSAAGNVVSRQTTSALRHAADCLGVYDAMLSAHDKKDAA